HEVWVRGRRETRLPQVVGERTLSFVGRPEGFRRISEGLQAHGSHEQGVVRGESAERHLQIVADQFAGPPVSSPLSCPRGTERTCDSRQGLSWIARAM